MVGREDELGELQEYLQKAAQGKGSTVFISGEAGIGKTRLIEELRQVAESEGFQVLLGYSLHESLTPYMPFLDALRSGGLETLFAEEAPKVEAVYLITHGGMLIKDVLREKTELDPDLFASMLTAVGNFVIESMSKLSGEEREGTLSGLSISGYEILIEAGRNANLVAVITGEKNEFLIDDMRGVLSDVHGAYGQTLESWDGDERSVEGIDKLLERLITSGKYDGIYYGREDPKARRNLLFENVSLGLVRHAQTTPTMLCIEDLQWADPSSLALMHYVARNSGKCGLLMVGTYRPEDVAAEDGRGHPLMGTMQLMDREDLHRQLELQRLPADKMADFMRALLGEIDFDDDFMIRIHKETEGNPLFVIQLVKLLVEEGIIARKNGTWRLAKSIEEIDIPSKTYTVILRRLSRIEKDPRRVLDYASVVGDVFTSDTLADALDMKRILLLEHLKVLEQTHRMIHPHNGGYKFDHAKIREALYNEIPQELREEYHAVIAQSIERLNEDDLESVIGNLAFHYYHCRNNEKALHYLTRAAERAKEDYSNEEAVRFYKEALEFEEDNKKRMEIFEALGDIYKLTGEYIKGIESYEEAFECAREDRTKAGIKAKIAYIHMSRAEYDDSIRISTEACDLVKDIECKEEARALSCIGTMHYLKGEYDKALEYLTRGLEIDEKIGNQHAAAGCLNNLGGVAYRLGEHDKALECYERALKISEKTGSQDYIANHLVNIGEVHFCRGEYDEALGYGKRALEIYERIGEQNGAAICLSNTGLVLMHKGEFDEALEHFEGSLEISEKIGARRTATYDHLGMGEVHLRREDFQMALDSCNLALDLSKETDHSLNTAKANKLLGMIYREQGSWRESIRCLEESIRLSEEHGVAVEAADSCYEFGLMWKKKGEEGRASTNLNKALDMFEKLKLDHRVREVKDALESLDECISSTEKQ